MFVAQDLRKQNIAEYLLYMWQVEDLLRAFKLDANKFSESYLQHFSEWTAEQKTEAAKWYEEIANMMREEKVAERGHLQICKNVIINLEDLHLSLMNSSKFPYYHSAYHQALPLIVELRAKQPDAHLQTEIESCFALLYGITMLKMKRQTISQQTLEASKTISTFIGMLTNYYHLNLKNPLEL